MHMLRDALSGIAMVFAIVAAFVLITVLSVLFGTGTGLIIKYAFSLAFEDFAKTSILSGLVWCLVFLGAAVGIADKW